MSSLALYRRYRPETFAEVIGQEHVTDPLQQALRNNRVNHAYLFSGPRGCGKTTSARILARCLNCEEGPTPTPCGKCQSCLDLARNGRGSIDVIEIDAASHGGVDDARELREKAFFGPASSRYKIYIIDEAHMVTSAGFNALLKVVEEPPEHLKFIFATTEPEKVIGTIRSRTHHYPFRLVPPGTLREYLAEVCGREDIPVEDGVLPLVVRAGAGSVRDSMSVMDQLLAGAGADGVTYAMATALLGYTDGSLLDSIVEAFAAGDGAAAFEMVDRVIEGGNDPRRFVADLLERLRDLVILAAVPDAGEKGLIDAPADVVERMTAQASVFGAAELSRAADLVNTGLTEMRGATSPRLQLELICARVLLPAAYDDERSVQARLDRLERGAGAALLGGGGAGGMGGGAGAGETSGPVLCPWWRPVAGPRPDMYRGGGSSGDAGGRAGRAVRTGRCARRGAGRGKRRCGRRCGAPCSGSVRVGSGCPGGSCSGGSCSGCAGGGAAASGGEQQWGDGGGAAAPQGGPASAPQAEAQGGGRDGAPARPEPGPGARAGAMAAVPMGQRGRWGRQWSRRRAAAGGWPTAVAPGQGARRHRAGARVRAFARAGGRPARAARIPAAAGRGGSGGGAGCRSGAADVAGHPGGGEGPPSFHVDPAEPERPGLRLRWHDAPDRLPQCRRPRQLRQRRKRGRPQGRAGRAVPGAVAGRGDRRPVGRGQPADGGAPRSGGGGFGGGGGGGFGGGAPAAPQQGGQQSPSQQGGPSASSSSGSQYGQGGGAAGGGSGSTGGSQGARMARRPSPRRRPRAAASRRPERRPPTRRRSPRRHRSSTTCRPRTIPTSSTPRSAATT
ncbi:DNA polymerase III subunit gamma and tau [Streptomyces lydicus]|nr:DNA polymerase III subunit gamma and tau [Streptomyces lydicus]